MLDRAPWIWIPEEKYPAIQRCPYNILTAKGRKNASFAVVRFEKTVKFGRPVAQVDVRAGGDTFFELKLNGRTLLSGASSAGGDFLNNELPRPETYFYSAAAEGKDWKLPSRTLRFTAEVRLGPTGMYEHSQGHGGFFMSGTVTLDDGTRRTIGTDEGWEAEYLPQYSSRALYDGRLPREEKVAAVSVPDIWHAQPSPVPACELKDYFPAGGRISLPPYGKIEKIIPLNMVYAGYPAVRMSGSGAGPVRVRLYMSETPDGGEYAEELYLCGNTEYLSRKLQGVGRIRVEAENLSGQDAVLRVGLRTSCYPAPERSYTRTSDPDLDRVTEVCAHSLKYCRQTIHLDSPKHCEPLACTGDYFIEMCMTAFTYGDMRLAAADVRRTASIISSNRGRMFHTTYSLIWVEMLWKCYTFTAERRLLEDCGEALLMLLELFDSYTGGNGLIESPPDWMFVDWLFPDGISLHHPPKALGQSCMNMFYYNALVCAGRVFAELGRYADAGMCADRAESLKSAVLSQLYDPERGLFFEGLNTPERGQPSKWLPENIRKRYYRRHANILAAYAGILPEQECRELLRRIFEDSSLGEVQPYFCHFWLEAVRRNGLREEQTLKLLSMWKKPVKECHKGLPEGFYPPENYVFDRSHAWAGTPAYALPMALTGLEILEPGYKKIRLSPSDLGLSHFRCEIPTPYGTVAVEGGKDEQVRISAPDGIEISAE